MGEQLIESLTEATGLPKDLVTDELQRLITSAGLNANDMTLEDLRQILADYVQDVLVAAHEEFSKSPSISKKQI